MRWGRKPDAARAVRPAVEPVDRGMLVAAARPLFAERGFVAVTTADVAQAAGVASESVHATYPDLTELFADVLTRVQDELAANIVDRMTSEDPMVMMRDGLRAWLELTMDAETRRILLVDGPVVLGWDRWREIGTSTAR